MENTLKGSVILCVLVLSFLLILGPAKAFVLVLGLDHNSVSKGQNATYSVNVSISTNESVPIDYIKLSLNGTIDCKFDADGNVVSGCVDMIVNKVNSSSSYGYGYAYGYGYGYGQGILSYTIVVDTTNFNLGTYTSEFTISSNGNLVTSNGSNLTVVSNPISGSGSGSGSGSNVSGSGSGSSNGNSGDCIGVWKCTDWSTCIDSKMTRTCTNQKSYCYASKPAVVKACNSESNVNDIGSGNGNNVDNGNGNVNDTVDNIVKENNNNFSGNISKITASVINSFNGAGVLVTILVVLIVLASGIAIWLVRLYLI